LRQRQRRHFDRGEADLAAVIEHEAAAIDDAACAPAGDDFTAARKRLLRPFLRHLAETSKLFLQIRPR
jgi:hypothetical protein